MDYFSFRKSFEAKLSSLKIPSDCALQEPTWEITAPPYFWSLEVFFRFSDQKHVRIWESHGKFAGLQESRRIQWAYHYGPLETTGVNEEVTQGSHYDASHISGLDLKTVDSWNFLRAVFKHRKTGQQFTKILDFKITE